MYLTSQVDKLVREVDNLELYIFCFGLSFLIGSSHVHKFFNVKLVDHTSCLYSVQNRNGEQIIWDKF
jgi:hypothetical protein